MMEIRILIALLVINIGFSQEINTSNKVLKGIESKITYVVLSENEEIDGLFRSLLDKYWKLNKLEYITTSQANTHKDEGNLFMSIGEFTYTRTSSSSTSALNMSYSVNQLMLYQELKVKKNSSTPIGMVADVQIDSFEESEMIYAIQLIQNQVNFGLSLDIKGDLKIKEFFKEISEQKRKLIREQTFYAMGGEIHPDISDPESLKKVYPYPVRFAEAEDEVKNAILKQKEGVVYARRIKHNNIELIIFVTAKNAEMLYGRVMTAFDRGMISEKFFMDIKNDKL